MSENKTILETRQIHKYFEKPVRFHALKDINLTIKKGEFTSVIGKSGCGKSTLLYILSTMDTSYEGKLLLNDEVLTGKSPDYLAHIRNASIGFVFQFHYLLGDFSVLENVMLPALKLGKKSKQEVEQDAIEKLKLLELDDQALKSASRLSGGQKQRVAIARALINEPAIIMGDEPTGNLDSKNAENVYNIFNELNQNSDLSLLIVTHDLDFAKRSHRIIEMEDGRIIS